MVGWNTTPMAASAARGARATSWPATSMRPLGVVKSRVIRPNSVDLPAPLGPSNAQNAPGSTAKLTPSSARSRP